MLLLAGCGDDDEPATSSTSGQVPTRTQPAAAPTTTGEDPATATLTEPNASTTVDPATATLAGPEDEPGGAGDDVAIRVPAVFTFRDGGVKPSSVTVPAFLAVELTLVSADGKGRVVVFDGRETTTIAVPAGGQSSQRFDGFKPGSYRVRSDDGATATLVVGGEPGP